MTSKKWFAMGAGLLLSVILVNNIIRPQFWERIRAEATIAMLRGRGARLNAGEKYMLFEAYYEKKSLVNALRVADLLKGESNELPSEIRIVLAAKVAKILRADRQYDFEFMFYDQLLKDKDPDYYHLFRGNLYKTQGNLVAAKQELLQAKTAARNAQVLKMVDTEMQSVNRTPSGWEGVRGKD